MTTASSLRRWRKRNHLTQVGAAILLGISQPYCSLLEKGLRPLTPTLRDRMKTALPVVGRPLSADDHFRARLSALGYPGFAHVAPAKMRSNPDAFLLSVLATPDADARVIEALPWLVRQYVHELDFTWLVRQAKLQNLQNRLGFVLRTSGAETPQLDAAVQQLEQARLLQESTLCWDSMPAATREWMRVNRTPLAEHWNVLTRLQPEDIGHAA
jgi:hypothetical protein